RGANGGRHREVPRSRGQGDERRAGEARETAFAFVLLTGTLGALGCAGAALLVGEPLQRHVLFAIAAVLLLNQLRHYYGTLLKADNRFREASIGSGLGSAAAVLSLPIIWFGGMAGFVWGLVGMLAVETAYLAARAGVPA